MVRSSVFSVDLPLKADRDYQRTTKFLGVVGSMIAQLNHSQPRSYGSVVTSPLFGLPTGYTGARTVSLSLNFNF